MGRISDGRLTRRDALKLGAAGGAAVAVACTPIGTVAGSPTPSLKKGGTLVLGQGSGPAALEPAGPGQTSTVWNFLIQIFDPLIWVEDDKYVPWLVTSWKAINPLTWELKLRENVKFHNGEPFDAAAAKFSIERVMDPKQRATHAVGFADVSGIEIVDASTLRINTKVPSPVILNGLEFALALPPKYTQADPANALKNPVGTGPFKFVDFAQGDRLSMAANEDYWGGRAILDKLVFRIIPDDSARLAALKAGEIQIDIGLPVDAIDELSKDPNLTTASTYVILAEGIDLDQLRGGPTANVKVRQALNYAVDKDSICKNLLRGTHRPLAGQLLTPGVLGFNPNLKAYPYDPAKAKQLLAEAGYANGFDTTLGGPIGRYAGDRDVVSAVAEQLRQVGVRVQTASQETSAFFGKVVANQAGPMYLIGRACFGEPNLALIWSTSKGTAGIYHNDPQFDQLVFGATATVDEKEREKLYYQATQYMYDQAFYIFLFQPATYYGFSKKVVGFKPRSDEFINFQKIGLSA